MSVPYRTQAWNLLPNIVRDLVFFSWAIVLKEGNTNLIRRMLAPEERLFLQFFSLYKAFTVLYVITI